MKPGVARRIKQAGLGTIGLLAGIVALCWYGWRCGFTPLPAPVAGGQFEAPAEVTWDDLTPAHRWYWPRVLGRLLQPQTNPRRPPRTPDTTVSWDFTSTWVQAVEAWAQSATYPSQTQAGFEAWQKRRPEVESCLQGVLRTTDSGCPVFSGTVFPVPGPGRTDPTPFTGAVVLSHYTLLKCAEAESNGRVVEAFQALVEAWRFQARITPHWDLPALFDERGIDQVNALLAHPWRRLALSGPRVPRELAGQILADSAAVTNALPPLEASYIRLATQDAAYRKGRTGPDWGRVRTAFQVATLRLRQDFGRLVSGVIERLVGGRHPAPITIEGARHFARPLRELVTALQYAAARPEDFTRIRDARLSHALAQLRGTDPYIATTNATAPRWPTRERWSWWRRTLDRPAVWDSVSGLPSIERLRELQQTWEVFLESCRLTLALRVFRDQRGYWPDRLDELVPDILPAVPLDPFTDRPFGYEKTTEGWTFWSVGPAGRRPTPIEAEQPPQRVFTSREAEARP